MVIRASARYLILRLAVIGLALVGLAAILGACSALTIVNVLTPTDTYSATADLAYGPDPKQRVDVYQPKLAAETPAPRDGYPVVVFFHGGTWVSGERQDYRFVGEALASQGIVAVITDYRLYPQVRYPDFLRDCAGGGVGAARGATLRR
jgi:acetyl esterase/lipase